MKRLTSSETVFEIIKKFECERVMGRDVHGTKWALYEVGIGTKWDIDVVDDSDWFKSI